jgi:hypothetical protein
MRMRTNLFVTLDGRVSSADGRPVQLLLPGFSGAGSHRLPEFLATCEPLGLSLQTTRTFPDGVIEVRYTVERG